MSKKPKLSDKDIAAIRIALYDKFNDVHERMMRHKSRGADNFAAMDREMADRLLSAGRVLGFPVDKWQEQAV